jgi:hypothetical protein
MCIFAHEVKVVRDTRILVGPASKGRQVTVYENAVEVVGGYYTTGRKDGPREEMKGAAAKRAELAKVERKRLESANAMILPCPHDEDSLPIELLDLSGDGFRFATLEECFPRGISKYGSKGKAAKYEADCEEEGTLEVLEVGAYSVSVAKTLKDLKRVDRSVFSLSPDVDQLLGRRYGTGFAFVICAFDASRKLEPHPVAYVHSRPATDRLFVPCVHEHGHAHAGEGGKERFDHLIYSLSTSVQTMGGSTPEETLAALKRQKDVKVVPAHLTLTGALLTSRVLFPLLAGSAAQSVRRLELRGMYPNEDLIMSLDQGYHDSNAPLLTSVPPTPLKPPGVQQAGTDDPYDVRKNLPTSEQMRQNLDEWRTLYSVLKERLSELRALPTDANDE